jgi:glycosyltransferase involved in cell wall biosynthesis
MPPVSVTIITRNEAAHIAAALASVAWADERIVVDSGSTDATVDIARAHGARVETRAWDGYATQKNFAASIAAHDWIFSLDADERVGEALADEVRQTLDGESPARGYRVPRVTHYLGKWIRSTDWWPDWQLRLYDRRAAHWTRVHVHESVHVNGQVRYLRGELLHYPYTGVADHLDTIDRYTSIAARELYAQGRRASFARIAVHPALAFGRNYVLRGGFRQGTPGLIVSLLNSYYVLLKFAKLWELERRQSDAASTRDHQKVGAGAS